MRSAGSSPRVRGKRRGAQERAPDGGLIPARAGKTPAHGFGVRDKGAHPRACGENFTFGGRGKIIEGSSPRVRGKLERPAPTVNITRLIPARAGKTGGGRARCTASRAHPRACGENDRMFVDLGDPDGSSPRVRGKRGKLVGGSRAVRLIPARAGKTNRSDGIDRSSTAHPRACGENWKWSDSPGRASGSSPRVRGKLPAHELNAAGQRLIPARAGKTSDSLRSSLGDRAHPRACGENAIVVAYNKSETGSSPRVRGKRWCAGCGICRGGLIPARAGKTWTHVLRPPATTAHPRACGENSRRTVTLSAIRGSSPRVRGKPERSFPKVSFRGLIPARAGKTGPGSTRVRPCRAHPRACGENAR